MLRRISDREDVERFIQDLKVNARDVDDYLEKRKLKEIIEKFQEGYKEEYTRLFFNK